MIKDRQLAYAESCRQELHDLICQLAVIPAPSHKEEKRADFCLHWFHENGLKQAFIDDAGNVVVPIPACSAEAACKKEAACPAETDCKEETACPADADCKECSHSKDYTVFMAHMDVVFPDESPLPLVEADGIIHCPGIMDNTANLVNLMMTARYLHDSLLQEGTLPNGPFLFVCSVGEEGLGNLKGVRAICERYGSDIKAFYALDLTMDQYTALAVGSLRYKLTITTPGGHSFLDFGKPNANHLMALFLCGFYQLPIPEEGHTSYNAGVVEGGTSVNTIAQKASALLEIRSDCFESMSELEQAFLSYVESRQADLPEDCSLQLSCIGHRPCEKNVAKEPRQVMFQQVESIIQQVTGEIPRPISCSTDCNIPLSMGIPSVCLGTCTGAGAHTREEWAEAASFLKGLKISLALAESVYSL